MSNRLFQSVVHQMKDTMDCIIGVIDETAAIIACSELSKIGTTNEFVSLDLNDSHDIFIRDGYTYKPFGTHMKPDFAVFVEGVDDTAAKYANILAISLSSLKQYYDEKYDRNNFIQNILLGNMLVSDIINRAKKLHIENRKRVVYVIDTGKNSNEIAVELAKNLADIRSGDFVVAMDEHNVVLVKDVEDIDSPKLQEKLSSIAGSLVDNQLAEAMIKVRVGYGNPTDVLPKITESYQEAKMALEVGRLFYVEKEIMAYDRLGIGRLIYQLPMSLCEMFIREVFGDEVPQILDDEEAMSTISKFFENNLNISETARQLYVHRNTLVYRLERIEKSIGLDIRTFDDAMIFKIATMVLAHIKDSRQGR